MNTRELLDIIDAGETTRVEFKEKMPHPASIAEELIAMSNSLGGIIIFGVKDRTGVITGLTGEEIREYREKIRNIAEDKIIPAIYISTEVVSIDIKKTLIVHIREGINKPYKDKKGAIFVKNADSKRRVTDNSEILRLFQSGGNLTADEIEIPDTSINDIDNAKIRKYFSKVSGIPEEETELNLKLFLQNINALKNNRITLGGLLFFGKNPQQYKPAFCIKAISFFGNDISGSYYRDSADISGVIPELFDYGMNFFKRNLKHTQQGQNFNSLGILEISEIALEEILQNGLVHRDYFKNAPIRIMIFEGRVEVVSPGKLPNSLTVENIKAGNAVVRNNLLASYCVKTMRYRGFGSGIRRILKEEPDTEFINDIEGEQFIVKIPRK